MAIFGNGKEQQNTHELSSSNTHIAKGAILNGDMETYGTIRLEGKIFGNLRSKGKTSLGESAYVQGNILAQSAEIAGEVKGTVEISEILTKQIANFGAMTNVAEVGQVAFFAR